MKSINLTCRHRRPAARIIGEPEHRRPGLRLPGFGTARRFPGDDHNATVLGRLLPEYEPEPIGIVTVSAGGFGGINCLAWPRLVTLAMGACPIAESLAISRVHDSLNDDGAPNDPA